MAFTSTVEIFQEFQDRLIKNMSDDGVEFRFILSLGDCARSKLNLTKIISCKTVGTRVLKRDEMRKATIDAILNSRSMTAIKSEPNDYDALTIPITAIISPDECHVIIPLVLVTLSTPRYRSCCFGILHTANYMESFSRQSST